jgi:hypothetical protein
MRGWDPSDLDPTDSCLRRPTSNSTARGNAFDCWHSQSSHAVWGPVSRLMDTSTTATGYRLSQIVLTKLCGTLPVARSDRTATRTLRHRQGDAMSDRLRNNYCGTTGAHSRKIAERDGRDGLDGDSSRSEARDFRNVEPRTSDRALLACLALHAPRSVVLADFFNIMLTRRLL